MLYFFSVLNAAKEVERIWPALFKNIFRLWVELEVLISSIGKNLGAIFSDVPRKSASK